MTIHCPQCGKPAPADFKFCLGCGRDLVLAREAVAALGVVDAPGTLPRVPPAPRTPSPRARGVVFAYTGTQAAKRLIGGIFAIVGLALFLGLGHGLAVDVAVLVAGERVTGKVTRVRPETSVSINGVHPLEIFFEHGGHRGSSSTLDLQWGASLQPGQAIEIETIPGWPLASRARGTMYTTIGWLALLPLIFTLLGLPMLVSAVRSNRREIRAFRFGAATIGRVTSFGLDPSVRVNGRNPTVLRWEIDVGGVPFQGSLSHMERLVLASLVAGDRVAVVYDRDDPRANTLYVP